jgi:hypothetical protein
MSYGFLEEIVKNKILIASAITVALVSAFLVKETLTAPKIDCVNVYVDYGVLNNGETSEACIRVEDGIDAMSAFNMHSVAIQGTDKYGLQIVCRVNSFPNGVDAIPVKDNEGYVERCTDMPAQFAYWALLVKRGSGSTAVWGWSDKGILDLDLDAGDSVALVFTVNDEVKWPE